MGFETPSAGYVVIDLLDGGAQVTLVDASTPRRGRVHSWPLGRRTTRRSRTAESAKVASELVRESTAAAGVGQSPQEPGPDRLLTTGEVAAILDVSPETVRRWCNQGLLPSVKINRHRRIPHSAVAAAIRFDREIDAFTGGRVLSQEYDGTPRD